MIMDENVQDLNQLRKTIETLTKFHQIEILKRLKARNVVVSENTNGTFVNMSELDASTLQELRVYIDYVESQEASLKNMEHEKSAIETQYFHSSEEILGEG
jgi:ABC-type molybdenum transport system ATPase subunit/photorepair protein PhrA